MGNAYIFSLQPTFTQGLILGQFSVFFLLVLILKYLFFDTVSEHSNKVSSYLPKVERDDEDDEFNANLEQLKLKTEGQSVPESADWLNVLLQQVAEVYRMKLRDNKPGPEGDEVARKRVEKYANQIRPPGFLDPIKVHSVDLGVVAPQLSRARRKHYNPPDSAIEFDMTYVDTLSVSLSTSVLFNYPFPAFARLPVSLTVSLSLFSSSVLLTPPQPQSPHPTITFTLPTPQTEFTLELRTTSLMGSRAKLADVPKLHELITHQIRRVLEEKGTWKVVLPGLATVKEVKEDVLREQMLEEALS
ncbi:Maintenance of mitochondrial morphology protein [Sparassis crispa]|uniref:Maintenance of mitochondrial morphology protein n=1 Tax=Sparassis crispa TaxID=139825 RepID=A0A401G802_9APHY|nr:Maintenance of mitochondrial morphology protein [Sparassis crispa]GBE78306.1 Maintenance of mitochondrial morphology protein [Sparassis crispa]